MLRISDVAYRVGRRALQSLYQYETVILGERPPAPALFASNHYGSLDPILLTLGLQRNIATFTRKRGHWGHPPGFIPGIGRIPLNPSRRAALDQAREYLANGYSLAIFPEGIAQRERDDGREAALGFFKPGVFFFATQLHLPVVPIAIHGAAALWPTTRRFPRRHGRLILNVGKPLPLPTMQSSFSQRRNTAHDFTQRLQKVVAELYEEATRHRAGG